MAWSGITSVQPYSAGNAVAITYTQGEPIKVRTRRPSTGPDGIVVLYDASGNPIQSITVSASNPIQETEILTTSATLNFSTTIGFDAPGLTVEVIGQPIMIVDSTSIQFDRAVAAPGLGKMQRFASNKSGQVACWRLSGWYASADLASTTAETWLMVIEAPTSDAIDGISVEFPRVVHGSLDTTPNIFAIKSVGSLADALAASSLDASWNQPAAPVQTRVADFTTLLTTGFSTITSNIASVASVARNDGGTNPLYAIVVGYATGTARTLIKYTSASTGAPKTAWRTGSKINAMGSLVSSDKFVGSGVGNWPVGNQNLGWPIVGVNFYTRKPTYNVMRIGDSKNDGNGAAIWFRDGFIKDQLAAMQAEMGGAVVFGDMNFSMPGNRQSVFFPALSAYLASANAWLPDCIVCPILSINDMDSSDATTTARLSIANQRLRTLALQKARSLGIKVITYNTTPCTTAAKDLTLSDYQRVANNTQMAGIVDMDFASIASGANVGGQIQLLAEASSDGTHENDLYLAKYGAILKPLLANG